MRDRYVTATRLRSTAPLSVCGGSTIGSPHVISHAERVGVVGRHELTDRHRSRRLGPDLGDLPTGDVSELEVGHVEIDHDRRGGRIGDEPGHEHSGDLGRDVPLLVLHDVDPALTLDAPTGDGLAHGDARDAAIARRQAGADRARVVDGATDVGAGVDARHDEIERIAEHAQLGVQHAQCGRAVERPRFGDAVDLAPPHLGAELEQGPHGGTCA